LKEKKSRRFCRTGNAASAARDADYLSLRFAQSTLNILSIVAAENSRYRKQIEQKERTADLLRRVGLDPGIMHRYPHEFSGGQRQRIRMRGRRSRLIEVIICDRPVSADDNRLSAGPFNLLPGFTGKEFGDLSHARFGGRRTYFAESP